MFKENKTISRQTPSHFHPKYDPVIQTQINAWSNLNQAALIFIYLFWSPVGKTPLQQAKMLHKSNREELHSRLVILCGFYYGWLLSCCLYRHIDKCGFKFRSWKLKLGLFLSVLDVFFLFFKKHILKAEYIIISISGIRHTNMTDI